MPPPHLVSPPGFDIDHPVSPVEVWLETHPGAEAVAVRVGGEAVYLPPSVARHVAEAIMRLSPEPAEWCDPTQCTGARGRHLLKRAA